MKKTIILCVNKDYGKPWSTNKSWRQKSGSAGFFPERDSNIGPANFYDEGCEYFVDFELCHSILIDELYDSDGNYQGGVYI